MTDHSKEFGPLTVIEWSDSCSLKGGVWNSRDDVKQLTPDTCRSVGWVLSETKDGLVLVPHASTHQVGGEMCIPKVAIRRRWVMVDPGKKRGKR